MRLGYSEREKRDLGFWSTAGYIYVLFAVRDVLLRSLEACPTVGQMRTIIGVLSV